ncbi:MAG: efflux RND transporter permease subunit [Pseudomonadota bacterium]
MSFTKLAIENSRATVMAVVIIIFAGVATFLNYPQAEDPAITVRTVSVSAFYPGMSPERVEDLISKPIESAMRELADVDIIASTSKTGEVVLKLVLKDSVTDLEQAFSDIRTQADDVRRELPDGVIGPFVEDELGLTAVATVALWADGFSLPEIADVAGEIQETIYTLDGVRKVEIFGEQDEAIYLETLPSQVAELDISTQEVFGAIAQQNIIRSGGSIVAAGRNVIIEPSGNYETEEDIRDTVFRLPNTGRVLTIGDVASVERRLQDPPVRPAFFNNREAVVLSISTLEGTNNVKFGDDLTRLLSEVQQDLPVGYLLNYATYQPTLISESVRSAVSNVYQTLAIVLIVVLVFLGVRTGLIVGFFVPLTVLLGVVMMRFLGIELQRMSIAATIISLGLLVDNGIVVAEDIRVRLSKGVERARAAAESAHSLALPLLTSSLTTIFAFVPMLLVPGGAGEYVRSLAQVVIALLLVSWLLSMTVTPAMCAWFLKAEKDRPVQEPTYRGAGYWFYRRILSTFLRRRLLLIALLVGALIISIGALRNVEKEFFPLGDRNEFLVYVDFEAGTDIRETQAEIRKLTAWLSDDETNPEVLSNIAYVGSGGPRFFLSLTPFDPDPHRAFVHVRTKTLAGVGPVIERTNAFIDSALPTASADAKRMWFGATEPGSLKIRLSGLSADLLVAAGETVADRLRAIPGASGVRHDWENRVLKVVVEVDQTRAQRAGVTSTDIANALNTTFSGNQLTEFREGDDTLAVILRGAEELRLALGGLPRVQVFSASTQSYVSLGQVATPRPEWVYGRIVRRDQRRTLTVEARHPDLTSTELLDEIQETLDGLDLPAGYAVEIGGEIEDQANANRDLFAYMPHALFGILILLVSQFNSFRAGGIIVATVPLILIGGVVGLIVMNGTYGFMVLLGFFSLAGILINNGIVLVDRIQYERSIGREPLDAVATACLARLRPILITTATTVLGLIPLIISGGALFYSMACVIAFGLVVATMITLGFVPALYSVLFGIPIQRAPNAVRAAPATLNPQKLGSSVP